MAKFKFSKETEDFIRMFNAQHDGPERKYYGTFSYIRNSRWPEGEYDECSPPQLTRSYIIGNGDWKAKGPIQPVLDKTAQGFESENLNLLLILREGKAFPIIELFFRDPAAELDWYPWAEHYRTVSPCLSVMEFDMIINSLTKMKELCRKNS